MKYYSIKNNCIAIFLKDNGTLKYFIKNKNKFKEN